MKSASWAVVNASGTPPAAVQSSSSGTGIAARSCTTRQLRLAAAADDRHHAVAELEAHARRGPIATTSPASSRPGMSGGEPGGAG